MQDAQTPQQTKRNRRPFLLRVFGGFWTALTWLRRLVFNFIFLLLLILVVASFFGDEEPQLPQQAPLVVTLAGTLVDQKAWVSPSDRLLNERTPFDEEMVLRELIEVIQHAAEDQSITGLILQLDYFAGGGMSKMQELGRAITAFKATGKPVLAYADNYSQQQYFVASYADEIHMHNFGSVMITGFGLYRNYFKDALDKLAVNFHVFKVGQFKDFVEPYIRNSMSDASRTHNSAWLNQLWQSYTQQVETARDLPPGSIAESINNVAELSAQYNGDMAQMALDLGLVDSLGSRGDYEQSMQTRFGEDENNGSPFLNIPYNAYKHKVLKAPASNANIGLIVARGNILDGHQPEGEIGGDSLRELIKKARNDDSLKALVLRIDSGGGSAFASEIIRQELQTLRDQGIPVIISMGSVAASGGYWISTASDEVWATPDTITGSIGVFGVLPTLERSLEKIGVHTDGIDTTKLSGIGRLDTPPSPEAAAVFQQSVESIYTHFLNLVANSRDSTPEQIHEIAQGRVWTGSKAQELGLVDKLGYLDDAVTSAANLAGLEQYQLKHITRDLSPQEQLMEQLLEHTGAALANDSVIAQAARLNAQWLDAFSMVLENTSPKQGFQTQTYALCLVCEAP